MHLKTGLTKQERPRGMKTIQTKQQYDDAIKRIEELYQLTDESTPADDPKMIELDRLGQEVEAYEEIHFPISKPSLLAVMKLRMYEMGITQKRLAEMLHLSPARISGVLSGKYDPSLKTAREISKTLNIDSDVVLGI